MGDQRYKIKNPKKLATSLLTESYFESSMTAPENNFVFNVYASNNNSRRNSSSRERGYSSSRSRSRSNSRPRHKYRDNSFTQSYRSHSYGKRYNSNTRNSQNSPYKKHNDYR